MNTDSNRDRRKGLALAAFLALAGTGGGAGLRFWMASRDASGGHGPTGSFSTAFSSGLSGGATAIWMRLLSALGLQGSRPLTIERLVKLLSGHKGDPVAEAFAADALRDPELRAIWDKYRRSRDSLGTSWLVQQLSDSKRFTELLNRYSNDKRFAQLGDSLARSISSAVVQGGAAGVTSGRDFALAGEGDGAARTGGDAHGEGSASSRGGRASMEVAGGGGAVGRQNTGVGERGDGEHRVLALATLGTAGPSQALNSWASLCYKNNGEISREQCVAINEHLGEDALWNACQKAGLLDKCVSLCRGNIGLGCAGQAEAMEACRSRWSAQTCAQACSTSADCRVADGSASAAVVLNQRPPDAAIRGPDVTPPCMGSNCATEPTPAPPEQLASLAPPSYADKPEQNATPHDAPTVSLPPSTESPKTAPPREDVPPPSNVSPPQGTGQTITPSSSNRRKHLPPWLNDVIDFFDDLFH